ncbi:hypothetical protein TIFTF001_047951 [Ficus carica]|uniref:Cycloartenol synthase n=1 Tax=Ficus carica TaxID=3494 RepID=A0AA87Z447_FICCA|nr:hypothetical protein TIFTF001_047951 [Ficus carica]
MWKLKIAEGGNPWLRTLNNHVGRQVWEFDPDLGSPEDLAQIEGPSTMFGSVLSYVTLRLLGEEANDGQGAMEGGRRKNVVSLTDDVLTNVLLIREEEDLYYPHPLIQDILWASLHKAVEPVLMRWSAKKLREKALRTVMEHSSRRWWRGK